MFKRKNRRILIPLTKGILGVLVILTVCMSVIAVFVFKGINNSYSNFISSETADFLSLYTKSVEVHLNQFEKLSYNILSNKNIQSSLSTYTAEPDTANGYTAYMNLYKELFMRMLDERFVDTGYFVFDSGSIMTLKVHESEPLSSALIQRTVKKAKEAKGKNIWLAGTGDFPALVCARQINATSDTSGFSSRGVLVIKVDTEFLNYNSQQNSRKCEMCCLVNEKTVVSPNSQLSSSDVEHLKTQVGSGIVRLGGERYFFVTRTSPVDGWGFICILGYDAMLSSISQAISRYVFLFFLLSILAMLLLSTFSRRICRPITQVIHSMDAVKHQIFQQIDCQDSSSVNVEESVNLIRSYNIMIERINYLIQEVYRKQLAISEMRYKILQQQINPHFLYNTLETIHWEAVKNDDQNSATMALNLSRLLRGSIKKPDLITVREDMNLLMDYTAIQKIRFEEKLLFSVENSDNFCDFRIPKMTLQPIVENSIRHNLVKYDCICKIRVFFRDRADGFSIFVQDNGKHTDFERIRRIMQGKEVSGKNGIGLKNIDERLRICFGAGYGLQISSNTEGTCVEIRLPYCLHNIQELTANGKRNAEEQK